MSTFYPAPYPASVTTFLAKFCQRDQPAVCTRLRPHRRYNHGRALGNLQASPTVISRRAIGANPVSLSIKQMRLMESRRMRVAAAAKGGKMRAREQGAQKL